MAQLEIESKVSVCVVNNNDRKIICETVADDQPTDHPLPSSDTDAEVPPESFYLSKDAEFDWFNHNAFFERKESTKDNCNSTNPTSNSNPNPISHRFSSSSRSNKGSIIGLPKTQKASYVDVNRRTSKAARIRMFPKRTVSKPVVSVTEPSSPKVSCMGRVRSKKGCRRSSEPGKKKAEPVENSRTVGDPKKTGFFSRLLVIYRSGKCKEVEVGPGFDRMEETVESVPRKNMKVRDMPVGVEPVGEPPSLEGMKRFASGRSGSWSAEYGNLANSDLLNLERSMRLQ